VTVTKSVSTIAPPGIYGGISVLSGDGITVNAPSSPGAIVVLRGLSITGQGSDRGITLMAAARLRVENCVVSAMHVAGISHTAANAELIVLDTIVRDNLGSGVYLAAAVGSLVLGHVRSEHNGGNGVPLKPSPGSLGACATITDSVFAHNEGDGIGADSVSGATITPVVECSVISNNRQNGFRGRGQLELGGRHLEPKCHQRQHRQRHLDISVCPSSCLRKRRPPQRRGRHPRRCGLLDLH